MKPLLMRVLWRTRQHCTPPQCRIRVDLEQACCTRLRPPGLRSVEHLLGRPQGRHVLPRSRWLLPEWQLAVPS